MLTCHSRQAIQKYIKANNTIGNVTDVTYKGHVNRAIVKGEETGIFLRPKGAHHTFPPVSAQITDMHHRRLGNREVGQEGCEGACCR